MYPNLENPNLIILLQMLHHYLYWKTFIRIFKACQIVHLWASYPVGSTSTLFSVYSSWFISMLQCCFSVDYVLFFNSSTPQFFTTLRNSSYWMLANYLLSNNSIDWWICDLPFSSTILLNSVFDKIKNFSS